ncbi:MAG: helix-hairpin-helix domain-containing protein [Pseudomonadota bacterium]|nr:helix-hairpin-helix domain-containing protein [Pseudomonadota bacterium]
MLKHEFYADPTVFDQWENTSGNWLSSVLEKLSPFSWALGFCGLAVAFLLVASGVFIDSLQHSRLGETAVSWNQALAQGVTIIIALTASTSLFKQAMKAWPERFAISDGLRGLAGIAGWRKPQQVALTGVSNASPKTPANLAADRQAVQEFFTGVRAAGVNVAIAKALFAAGVRSAQHLSQADDSYLHGIRGVGPATVRKLRAHFALH